MKSIFTVFSLVLLFLVFHSCKDESNEDPYQGKIKRVKHYNSIQDTIVRKIDEYKYDSKNRLKTIENSYRTVEFEYNSNNQLIGKYGYNNEDDIVTDSTNYVYKDGKLVVEVEHSGIGNGISHYSLKIAYEYENDRLVKKKRYFNNIFEDMTVYEYKDGLVLKESAYRDSLGLQLHTIMSHHYDDNKKLAVSNRMYAHSMGMAWLQTIYYFYNEHGDLDMEYAEQSDDVSAWIRFYNRYEYY